MHACFLKAAIDVSTLVWVPSQYRNRTMYTVLSIMHELQVFNIL